MKSSQVKSFKDIAKTNKKYCKHIGFEIVADNELDASVEYAQLTHKDRAIETYCKMKKKFSPKKILYPTVLVLLLAVTSGTVYGAMKMSDNKTFSIVKSDKDYRSLFEGAPAMLTARSLDGISKTDVLNDLTTWSENDPELHFVKDKIDNNIIKVLSPAVSKQIGKDNYINVRYELVNIHNLLADVRWCKQENNKLVGDVFRDSIEITL